MSKRKGELSVDDLQERVDFSVSYANDLVNKYEEKHQNAFPFLNATLIPALHLYAKTMHDYVFHVGKQNGLADKDAHKQCLKFAKKLRNLFNEFAAEDDELVIDTDELTK
jgi:hypothetical protein